MSSDIPLQPIFDIAKRAGAAILDVYAGHFQVTDKADQSPLTIADLRSHEVITEGLRNLDPTIPVLSEEASSIAFEVRSTWKCYWLVDPLDGTREFVSRNGEFTVNIALIENHEPVAGIVYVPVTDTLYFGTRASGASRIVKSGVAERINVRPAQSPLRVVGSRSHRDAEFANLLPRLEPCELVSVGSSIKFCLVAEGNADFYPRFGPTSEWDTAAAQAVLEAAGGAVVTFDGAPLRYNTKASLLNPSFIAFGDRNRDWLKYLAG
ncbi:MAG TPA: 3'(2'),5'-bisphosphate nucleotidase CysQ [Steroidobacteraceae bacterium]|nr:3'(2'),5'-bisphosphate nucleotidase CysQ [Steroidobacteraceae bacterium]